MRARQRHRERKREREETTPTTSFRIQRTGRTPSVPSSCHHRASPRAANDRPSWQIRHLIFFSLSKPFSHRQEVAYTHAARDTPFHDRPEDFTPLAMHARVRVLAAGILFHGTRRYWRYSGAAAISDTTTARCKRPRAFAIRANNGARSPRL